MNMWKYNIIKFIILLFTATWMAACYKLGVKYTDNFLLSTIFNSLGFMPCCFLMCDYLDETFKNKFKNKE